MEILESANAFLSEQIKLNKFGTKKILLPLSIHSTSRQIQAKILVFLDTTNVMIRNQQQITKTETYASKMEKEK